MLQELAGIGKLRATPADKNGAPKDPVKPLPHARIGDAAGTECEETQWGGRRGLRDGKRLPSDRQYSNPCGSSRVRRERIAHRSIAAACTSRADRQPGSIRARGPRAAATGEHVQRSVPRTRAQPWPHWNSRNKRSPRVTLTVTEAGRSQERCASSVGRRDDVASARQLTSLDRQIRRRRCRRTRTARPHQALSGQPQKILNRLASWFPR